MIMVRAEEHIRELLRLPARQRARAAKVLLDSLGESDFAEGSPGLAHGSRSGAVNQRHSAEGSRKGLSDTDYHEQEFDDDLMDLDDLAADKDGLRAAVRAAVEAELEPLHELTSLLRRFAELARTTGHTLRARTP